MPTPSYTTTINGVTALVLRDEGGGDFLYIDWDAQTAEQQSNLIVNLFDQVDEVLAITPATGAGPFPGFQFVQLTTGTVGGDATGLEAGRTYSFSCTVDGSPLTGTFLGSAASTYTALLSEINTILGAAATASLIVGGTYDGWLSIESATTGTGSSVVITPTGGSALASSAEYIGDQRAVNGGADLFDVTELSFFSTFNNWQEQFQVSKFGPSYPTSAGFRVRSVTLATLPTDLGVGGEMIYVSDATGASLTGSLCFSNGTVWIDVTTGAAVA
jgi:hypothetical protein